MNSDTKCLINNVLLLSLCMAVGVIGHPWLALIPLVGLSWTEKQKTP